MHAIHAYNDTCYIFIVQINAGDYRLITLNTYEEYAVKLLCEVCMYNLHFMSILVIAN